LDRVKLFPATNIVSFKKEPKMNLEDNQNTHQSTPVLSDDLPQVELKGASVIVNGKRLNLSRKARALRVVKAFFSNKKPSLTADEILDELNREEGLPGTMSPRAKKFQHGALVRMVSRIREEFNQTFVEFIPAGLTWFHYDRFKNHWVLFKMPARGADGLTY
jgi:hypothetical protein